MLVMQWSRASPYLRYVVRFHACVCILFLLIFIMRIYVFYLRAGNTWQYVASECVPRRCVLFVLLMKLIFGPRDLVPLLWCNVSILRSPWHFVCYTFAILFSPLPFGGFVYFGTLLFTLS
jgi:hypothetical protein